ncbi:MAG: SBBP repeat-containing protein [Bacteroidia bacterium]|nr:SBBP repeat-containing protein [Bacteroidia bacterium]
MRLFPFLFLFLLTSELIFSQTYQWTNVFNPITINTVQVEDVATDGSGNIYVAGYCNSSFDMDPGPGTAFSTWANYKINIFFAKYSPSGSFIWGKSLFSLSSNRAHSIEVDTAGNLYLGGRFWDSLDVDPGPGVTKIISPSSNEGFIAKYDPSGDFQWVIPLGNFTGNNAGGATTEDIHFDEKRKELYVAGGFYSTIDFDPGPGVYNLTSHGNKDCFFAKYSENGQFIWAKGIGSGNNDACNGIAIDDTNNVFITGSYAGSCDFDPGPGTFIKGFQNTDCFVEKLDSAGNFKWMKRIQGTGNEIGKRIELDKKGNIYVGGIFSGTMDADPGTGTYNQTAQGTLDPFLLRLDKAGNFVWAARIGGNNQDLLYGMTMDDSAHIFISGEFRSVADFDPGPGVQNLTANGQDIFIAKYDSSRNLIGAWALGGPGQNYSYDCAVDKNGNLYTVGSASKTIDFDPGPGIDTASGHSTLGYIHKMGLFAPCAILAIDSVHGDTNLCPSDSVELVASGGALFQWTYNSIPISSATGSSYFANQTGFYQVIVSNGGCTDTSAGISIVSQPVSPTWADFVGTSQSGDTLFEITSSNGWGSKAAASAQVLQPNQNGGLAHVVHENKGVYYIGLSWDNPSDPSQLTIDHAFYVNKSQLRVREAIGTDLVVGSVGPGDTLEIVRVGTTLNWLKNGSVVYTKAVDNSKSLRADASLFKKDSYLTNVWLTFCSTSLPLSVSGMVGHNDCANGPSGYVSLSVSGGTPPVNYSWSNGASTANNTSLEGGTYSVTVTDNAGGTAMASFVVLNRISWTDQVGAAGSVDTLSRTLPNSSWGTSGARSIQVLGSNADGYFMHLVNRLDRFYVIGLSDQNTDESQTTIDYAFYNSKGTLRIKEESGFDGSFGAITLGDTLKIERVGSTIKYWQNSTLIRSTSTNPAWSLMVDASLYSKGTVIYDIYSSFCTDSIAPDSFYATLVSLDHEDCFVSNGAAEVTGNGGVPPYSYLWSSAETTAAISGKAPGLYTCTVSDQNGMNQVISVEILSKIVWEGFIGSSAQGDTLMNINSSNGWGTSGARSDNKALNGSDGKVVHVVNSVSKNYYLGLSDADPDASQFTIDYAFYNNKGNLYIREEKTGFFQNYGTVAVGDTLVVERRISSMYWYQNGNLLRSIGISPTETLRVDVSMFSTGTEIFDTWVDFCDTVPGQKSGLSGNGSSLAAQGSQLLIYPNPAKGQINLQYPDSSPSEYQFTLLDLQGRRLQSWAGKPASLEFRGVASGMYLLRIEGEGFRQEEKLMVD